MYTTGLPTGRRGCSSEDTDLIPIHSGEDWVAQLDDDLSQPTAIAGDSFVFRPSNERILPALHYTHEFRRVNFPAGLK